MQLLRWTSSWSRFSARDCSLRPLLRKFIWSENLFVKRSSRRWFRFTSREVFSPRRSLSKKLLIKCFGPLLRCPLNAAMEALLKFNFKTNKTKVRKLYDLRSYCTRRFDSARVLIERFYRCFNRCFVQYHLGFPVMSGSIKVVLLRSSAFGRGVLQKGFFWQEDSSMHLQTAFFGVQSLDELIACYSL